MAGAAIAFAQPPLTAQDVARLRFVSDAQLSPDGTHVAYGLTVPRDPYSGGDDFEDGPAYVELHVADLTDGRKRPFVTGKVTIGRPQWTPAGDEILFTAKRDGDANACLYAIRLDGGEARRIVKHETDVGMYRPSLDGRRIAFLATEKPDEKKKALEKKGFKAEIYEEDLQFVRVWIVEWNEGEAKPRALTLPGSAVAVEWSPEGDRLAVALAPTPLVDDEYMKTRLHVVNAESGDVIAKIDNPGKLDRYRWSPDGKHLAMISAADLHDPDAGRLMVTPAKGGLPRDLIPGFKGSITAIAWQNADTIMFQAAEGVETSFNKLKLDGSERKTILPAGRLILTGLSLSRDGQSAAFVANAPEHPGEVFFMRHGDASALRLTNNNPWLAERRFARQEVVRYKARDGLTIEGILIHPLEGTDGQRVPLIVYVHGGPEAHESNGWQTGYSKPGQVAAGKGYASFYPNYRGSTGRGVAFSKLDQADEGGKEFDDLVDGVEHLVASGLVDRTKVGVTGGSYGGFASAWCATALSEHFAASVMFVGISDQLSKFGTTDIPNEMYLVHSLEWPWDDKWQKYLERSPIYHAKKGRTPILILAGKEDTRVHPSQSMELYRYLKTIGQVPVRLVLYPGEGHGNRKAGARLDYHLRMMQWMDHYLKGPGGEAPPYEIDYQVPEPTRDESESAAAKLTQGDGAAPGPRANVTAPRP